MRTSPIKKKVNKPDARRKSRPSTVNSEHKYFQTEERRKKSSERKRKQDSIGRNKLKGEASNSKSRKQLMPIADEDLLYRSDSDSVE